jgi:hypothetical protein
MPTNRIGFSSDFVLTSSQVGIGTTNPRATLDVVGVLKGDFNISGVTTLTSYAGFIPQKQNIYFDTTVGIKTVGVGTFTQPYETETGNLELVGQFNTVSEDIIVDEGKIFEITTTNITDITTLGTQEVYAPDPSVVSVGTLESVSIQSHFSVPDGGISERVDNPIEGSVRFNDDLNTLEFYNGIEWRQFTVTGASGRAVFTGGADNEYTMQFFNINTLGNAEYFGTLNDNHSLAAAFGSEIRGIAAGGYQSPGISNQDMDYYTIASAGNSIDFGDLVESHFRNCNGCSSSTRGLIFAGGHPAYYNTIEYVQINTLGTSKDFGDQTVSKAVKSSFSSSTRGFAFGGFPSLTPVIDVVTISSLGDAVKFGDLTRNVHACGSFSSSVRGVWGGGYRPGSELSKGIQYITMASDGNSIDFGELSLAGYHSGATSTNVRGVWGGGENPTRYNIMEYVTIASTGNAQDFGDLIRDESRMGGTSDSHGGLGGF